MEKSKKPAYQGRAHFIGIAGAGMSALAVLLKETGWSITGSDNNFYEPTSSYLRDNNIDILTPYSEKNIPEDVDLTIIGKHAKLNPEENEEVASALVQKDKVKSFPEVLGEITKDRENTVVVGSYGKSTCSALMAHCLLKSGKDIGYFFGAISSNLKKNAHMGTDKNFILEGDEYPAYNGVSKFLYLHPKNILLTSAEHDHINVFPSEKSYIETYKKLVKKIPKDSLLGFAYEDKNNHMVIKNANCKKISYALNNKKADYYAKNITYGTTSSFDFMHKNKKLANIKTKLLGKHNMENIIGVGALLLETKKLSIRKFAHSVEKFAGLKRRIELLNKKGKIPVFEGFGSSYDKAKVIFDTLKLHFPTKRIITIFEPHTFSWRNKRALKWYKTIFNDTEEVILLPPPLHGKNTHNQLTYNEIYNEAKKHTSVHKAHTEKEALSLIKKNVKRGDIIALISSGSLLGLSKSVPKLVEKIK